MTEIKGRIKMVEDVNDEKTFAILKAYFPDIQTIDKYPIVTMNLLFTDNLEKVLKRNNRKRISQKEVKFIKERSIKQLQARFGKWVNISIFELHNGSKFRFKTNFFVTYKTAKGILYGSTYSDFKQLFITSHCLKRFEERIDPTHYITLVKEFKLKNKYNPTSLDLILAMIKKSIEFGIEKDYRYLNIYLGALVIETFNDIFIVKTFLTPDMINPTIVWNKLDMTQFEKEDNNSQMMTDSIYAFFNHKNIM